MMKKILIVIIFINIIFVNYCSVFADDENEEFDSNDYIEVLNQVEDNLTLNSRIAVVYDRKSGNIIWGKNENKRTAMASTTKIMTAIVLLENVQDLNEIVTISQKSAGTGGSRLGLKVNDKITLNDLLYGLMLKSGNDAAVAIAERVGGSVDGFSVLMNEKAKQLGLENTHFVTPHGLDNPEHYTTAYELAKLADYALQNEKFAKVVNTKNYTVQINGYSKNIANTNELLGNLNGVNGVKTGFTNNAGRCLVTSVNRDGFEIITVVIQADTKKFRTSDSIKLIEYTYKNYELINLKDIVDKEFENWCMINEKRIQINKCRGNDLDLYLCELTDNIIPIRKMDKEKILIEVNSIFMLDAPVDKNTIIGNLKVMLNEEVIDVVEIRNNNFIEKKNIIDYFNLCMIELFN